MILNKGFILFFFLKNKNFIDINNINMKMNMMILLMNLQEILK